MPRIETSEGYPVDFCKRCFPSEATAKKKYGNMGDAPDNRGNAYSYDEDHPDYDDTDYDCEKCNKPLTSKDNFK